MHMARTESRHEDSGSPLGQRATLNINMCDTDRPVESSTERDRKSSLAIMRRQVCGGEVVHVQTRGRGWGVFTY